MCEDKDGLAGSFLRGLLQIAFQPPDRRTGVGGCAVGRVGDVVVGRTEIAYRNEGIALDENILMEWIGQPVVEGFQPVPVVSLSVIVEVVVVAHHEEELVHGIEDVLLAPEELHELLVLVGSSVIGEVAHHSHGVELAVRNLYLIACAPSVADVRVGDDGKGKPCLLTDGDEQWAEVFAADGKDGCAGITRVVLRHGNRQRAVGKSGLAPVGICAYRGILVGLDGDGFCRSDERKGDCAIDNLVGREGGSARGCQRTDNVGLCPKLRHGAKDNEQKEKYMSFHLDWHFCCYVTFITLCIMTECCLHGKSIFTVFCGVLTR